MATYIRLTDYRDSESKEQGFFEAKNRFVAKQEDFAKIPGSPIAYWVSDRVKEIFEKSEKLRNFADVKKGLSTGNNDKYLRFWHEVEYENIGLKFTKSTEAKISGLKWFPYNKGGDFRKWYGNNEYTINWQNDGLELKNDTSTLRNQSYYFRTGITWSALSTAGFGARFSNQGALFDGGGSCSFPEKNLEYILAILSSKISNFSLGIMIPTMNFEVGTISSIPVIFPTSVLTKQTIDTLTVECIDISREEWDSRETSWDFKTNGLLRFACNDGDGRIESAYTAYCDYWREKFWRLHTNEEELNRLFIEIYGLADELTPAVDPKDITILKSEADIVDGELVFDSGEIARQLVSYAVGCMFGRYCIDRDGLVVANMGQDYPRDTPFAIDDDNILPVLEEEVFSDDIVGRFGEFLRVAFGDEHYEANLAWIEKALGMSVRKYFVSEFYKDHVRRYKKRPIYWLIQSPKKSFSALIYMHRYQSDTMARVQTAYLREYITKTEAKIEALKAFVDSPNITPKESKESKKELEKLEAKLADARGFDRGEMGRIAAERIEIDLDDGVKVNYQKFRGVLADIGIAKDE